MSLSCEPIAQSAISGQSAQSAISTGKTPGKRKVIAIADRKGMPEPR
jgi:hypothetical protein